jgi:2-polyprenyl-6-methoxyphenol hydroxylase-like FAD-dependent oxidoreductase
MQISKRLFHHVAIVGSGPSGFYFAKYILERHPTIQVDLYEKLPVGNFFVMHIMNINISLFDY